MIVGFEQYWSSCKKCGTVNILDEHHYYTMNREEKFCQCGNKIQSDGREAGWI